MRTCAETTVDAAPEVAWAAVVDFKGRMKYSKRVKEAEVEGGGELTLGSRLRLQIDRNRFTLVVAEMAAPSRLTLEFRGPMMRGSHVYAVRADGDHRATVRIDAHYGGLLGSIFGALTKGNVRRDLDDELRSIKAQAEAAGGS